MRLKRIAVDFDGTLVNGDKLLPGAKEAMQSLRKAGYIIYIHSCNGYDWIEKVLRNNEVPYDYIWNNETNKGKLLADWYIDDRAIGFRGDWNAVLKEIYGDNASAETGEE